jgi:hypothetical protein
MFYFLVSKELNEWCISITFNYMKSFAVYLCFTIFLKLNKGVILSDFLRITLLFTVVCLKISRNTVSMWIISNINQNLYDIEERTIAK